jgi:AraC-like DNA-binding protein
MEPGLSSRCFAEAKPPATAQLLTTRNIVRRDAEVTTVLQRAVHDFPMAGEQMLLNTTSDNPSLPVPRITTVLTPDERLRVDAAGQGIYRAWHRESMNDALRDLREHRAAAVIVSIDRCDAADLPRVARAVREFPRVPAVALLSNLSPQTAQTVLVLGRCGVRTLVDVREPRGWQQLRSVLLHDQATEIHRVALARVAEDLSEAPEGCHRFFRALFEEGSETRTIQELSAVLGVIPSTLMSRFTRSGLPAPKFYLSMARLVCAARLFENPGLSITLVANELDYSSPQAFGRHLKSIMRITAMEFRQRYDGEGMLQHFRDELVLPHVGRLRSFDPLGLDAPRLARGYEAGVLAGA